MATIVAWPGSPWSSVLIRADPIAGYHGANAVARPMPGAGEPPDAGRGTEPPEEVQMSRLYVYAGIAASVMMIGIGIGAIAVGASGRSEVRDKIQDEQIDGTPDMNPDDTRAAVEEAGIETDIPDCTVAEERVDDGDRARSASPNTCGIHALEDTGGKTYAEMPRFIGKDGEPTAEESEAAIDPKSGEPVSNPQRNIWVTETRSRPRSTRRTSRSRSRTSRSSWASACCSRDRLPGPHAATAVARHRAR